MCHAEFVEIKNVIRAITLVQRALLSQGVNQMQRTMVLDITGLTKQTFIAVMLLCKNKCKQLRMCPKHAKNI